MYINFWYAADWSRNIGAEPRRLRMLGQDFVLYRESGGQVRCHANVCVHRGGSLAGGRLEHDRIACPYHGWQYDGAGICRKIPALGPTGQRRIPGRARIDTYPVEERYGLVHVFLGDLPESERPPIMAIPEFGQPGWHASCEDHSSEGDFRRNIENGLDPAHNEYVHPTHGFSGARDEYFVPELKIDRHPWGSGFITQYYSPPLKDEKMQAASGRSHDATIEAGTHHHGPTCMITSIRPTAEHFINQNVFKTPTDSRHQRSFLVQTRNFLLGEEHDPRFLSRNAVVRDQDRVVLADQEPYFTPDTNTNELLVHSDLAVATYREYLRDWDRRGWRIDSARVEADRPHRTYAIPGPARRREPHGWVIDPVPLLKVEAAADLKRTPAAD
ncbi:MAG: Rieske 2Fe-2S domain-containing protein [Gammaproteobacteria bacterium]|nr:Rieske 2Fe-2S domain-containing protein [Gammaproteobacteria bacterium]